MKKPDIVGIVSKLEPRYRIERKVAGIVNNIRVVLTLERDLAKKSSFWWVVAKTENDTQYKSFSLRFLAKRYFKKLMTTYKLGGE